MTILLHTSNVNIAVNMGHSCLIYIARLGIVYIYMDANFKLNVQKDYIIYTN